MGQPRLKKRCSEMYYKECANCFEFEDCKKPCKNPPLSPINASAKQDIVELIKELQEELRGTKNERENEQKCVEGERISSSNGFRNCEDAPFGWRITPHP